MSCKYLAHHELIRIVTIINIIIILVLFVIIIIIIAVIITTIIITTTTTTATIIIVKGLVIMGGCMVAQVLPQDWTLAAFCWPGWQDQDVGCQWQWQMHENVYGLYKGISPCFICAA